MGSDSIPSFEKMYFNNCYKEDSLVKAKIKNDKKGEIQLCPLENNSKKFIFTCKQDLTENKEEEVLDDSDDFMDEEEEIKEKIEIKSNNENFEFLNKVENFKSNQNSINSINQIFQRNKNKKKSNFFNKQKIDSFNFSNKKKTNVSNNKLNLWDIENSSSDSSNSFKSLEEINYFGDLKAPIKINTISDISKRQVEKILNIYNNKNLLNTLCSICYLNFDLNQEITIIKNCEHIFHLKCLNNWIDFKGLNKNTCPYCKNKIKID